MVNLINLPSIFFKATQSFSTSQIVLCNKVKKDDIRDTVILETCLHHVKARQQTKLQLAPSMLLIMLSLLLCSLETKLHHHVVQVPGF